MEYYHYIQLEADAEASLGKSHVISRVAANYVKVMDEQMAKGLRIPCSAWQKERAKDEVKENYRIRELELLKWAHVDLTKKVM